MVSKLFKLSAAFCIRDPRMAASSSIVRVGWVFYQEYLARIKTKFDFKEEALNEHLGVMYRFNMDLGICHMSQSDHVLKLLKLFGHEDCTATPHLNLDGPEPCAEDCEVKYKGTWDMESFNGNVLWLVMCTRPDIQKSIQASITLSEDF